MFKKFFIAPIMMLSFNSFAANPYTDCGIGAALFPNTHWAAVTSNVIWDAGSTAVTSATASEDTCNGSSANTAKLIHDKYELLETDIMLVSGSYLDALMASLQCADAKGLRASVKKDLIEIVSKDNYSTASRVEKSSNLYDALHSNQQISEACSAVS